MTITESALRPQEVLAGSRINGTMIKAHIKWVRDYRGDAAVAKLLAELPVEDGMEVSAARASSWVSFESLIVLDRAIERLFGRGVRLFQRELGRYSAHLNLAKSVGPFQAGELHRFLRCSAVLHTRFQDFGMVSYKQTRGSSARPRTGADGDRCACTSGAPTRRLTTCRRMSASARLPVRDRARRIDRPARRDATAPR